MNNLEPLGWNEHFASAWGNGSYGNFRPARVIADYGTVYKLAAPHELLAEASGRLLHQSPAWEFPKVGDWVAVEEPSGASSQAVIQAVLPRTSEINRRRPGKKLEKQVMAANVDVAFLVQALDSDFSPPRLQRYLLQLNQEHITPLLVLNKADKATRLHDQLEQMAEFGLKTFVITASTGQVEELAGAVEPGQTAVFLGSSGVGKSTIVNALLGEDRQLTQEVRAIDSKGRHTTTHRELFTLPGGGLLIDTPGIRELQLWGNERNLEEAFPDVVALAGGCRYRNCSHTTGETGCAVQAAIEAGKLTSTRAEDYLALRTELRELAGEQAAVAAQALKRQNRRPVEDEDVR